MNIDKNFEYHLKQLDNLDLDGFESFFNTLPLDPYLKGNDRFRERRFSRVNFADNQVTRLPHKLFKQSSKLNEYLGDVEREYEELDETLINHPSFAQVLSKFCQLSGVNGRETELGIHQIRTLCSPQFSGEPAPEGPHQDGFDIIAIVCIKRENIQDGVTQLMHEKNSDPIFSRTLQPGDLVMVNDRKLFHYTTPTTPAGERRGQRDVFVITV